MLEFSEAHTGIQTQTEPHIEKPSHSFIFHFKHSPTSPTEVRYNLSFFLFGFFFVFFYANITSYWYQLLGIFVENLSDYHKGTSLLNNYVRLLGN